MLDSKRWKEKFISFFENKRNFYIVLLAAMLLKNFPFGFRYFLFADDYNQYGVYALWKENLWHNVITRYSLYGYRPLAGITDVYFISRLWGNLEFVLLIFVLLHFLTIYLLDSVFERSDITWGRAAAIFFGFFPAMTESAYWISASSRIVTSAFFGASAVFAILEFIYKEGRYRVWLAAAMICGLLAQGFYEQGAIFAFTLMIIILIVHRKAIRNKLIFAWPFINLAIIGAYYYIFRDVGLFSSRAEIAENSFFANIPLMINRIVTVFIKEQGPTVINSLRWGIGRLFAEHLPLAIIVAVFSVLLGFFICFDKLEIYREKEQNGFGKKAAYSLLAGIILTICTLSLFFILDGAWVWVRNFFYAIIGLGILVEIAVLLIRINRHKALGLGVKAVKTAFAVIAVFVFFCGFILEVESLRLVEKYDDLIVSNLVAKVERMKLKDVKTIWLFGTQWSYAAQINPRITSQVRVDWALNGHYTVTSGNRREQWIVPVMAGAAAKPDFESDVLLGLDSELNIRELKYDGYNLLFADTGAIFGSIDPEENARFNIE